MHKGKWEFVFYPVGKLQHMPKVDFQAFKEREIDKDIIARVARLYCQVWKEPPWYEDFWEEEEVAKDILREIQYLGAIGFWSSCLEASNFVVGFTWGYPVDKFELTKIAKNTNLGDLFEKDEKLFYIDELGVEKVWRGMGVGMMISRLLIESVREKGHKKIVLRTDDRALPAVRLYKYLGFERLSIQDGEYTARTYWVKNM